MKRLAEQGHRAGLGIALTSAAIFGLFIVVGDLVEVRSSCRVSATLGGTIPELAVLTAAWVAGILTTFVTIPVKVGYLVRPEAVVVTAAGGRLVNLSTPTVIDRQLEGFIALYPEGEAVVRAVTIRAEDVGTLVSGILHIVDPDGIRKVTALRIKSPERSPVVTAVRVVLHFLIGYSIRFKDTAVTWNITILRIVESS